MKASIERAHAERHPRDVAQGLMLADPDPRFPRDSGRYVIGHVGGEFVTATAKDVEEARRLMAEFAEGKR